MNSANWSSRVLLPRVCGQQRIEIGQHVLHTLHGLRIRRLERLFDASKLGVQHLALQHVLDRLEDLAGFLGSPRILIKAPNSPGDIIGQRVQLELRQPRLAELSAAKVSRSAASAWSSAART
jgi:hypothetical protein